MRINTYALSQQEQGKILYNQWLIIKAFSSTIKKISHNYKKNFSQV